MLEMLGILFGLSPLALAWAIVIWIINQFKYDQNGWEIEKWWTKIRF